MEKKKKIRILKLLKTIYLNPSSPGSFSSSKVIKKILFEKYNEQVPISFINDWLQKQRAYFMHKPAKQAFDRNPIVVSRMDEQWQADLLFLPELAPFNNNIFCHLLVIDILTRFLWIEPMRNKTGGECTSAFKTVLTRASPRKPEKLQTDDGKEFFNSEFQNLMKRFNIDHFSTKSDLKAAVAERAIKTIKEKIYKYLSSNPLNNNYLHVLQDIVSSYNQTFHSSIGMAPAQVTRCNSGKVLWRLYHHIWDKNRADEEKKKTSKQKKMPLLKTGDYVRYSSRKLPLTKRYKGNWTEEIFKIVKIKDSVPYRLFKLADLNGEIIQGGFYRDELQKAENPKKRKYWHVDTILDSRKVYKNVRGERVLSHNEYLVKWFGYPNSFNEWVHEKDINTVPSSNPPSVDA